MKILSNTIAPLALVAAFAVPKAQAQMDGHDGHDMSKMTEMRESHMVEALAIVTSIDAQKRKIGLSHGAIPQISWPSMIMVFPVDPKIDLSLFKVGDKVQFTLHRARDGSLPLVELCQATSAIIISALCAPKKMDSIGGTPTPAKSEDHSQHEGH